MDNRLAFVDDDESVLDSLRRMLRKQEGIWEMHFFLNAAEALEATRTISFDTIVSDVRMPGINGFEFLKILRSQQETRDIPVIILTGAGEPALKRKALDMGATDLLEKPCEMEDLLARLRSALQTKIYQDEIKKQNETLEHKVQERTAELEASRMDILRRLAKAGEYRDEDTGYHVARVGLYCRLIAEALELEREFVEMIHLTSPLHDIGKIGISDSILLKPGKLTPEERVVMESHCMIGAGILQERPKGFDVLFRPQKEEIRPVTEDKNPMLGMASTIALCHHERWDGTGYPQRLRGEQIPLEARIVCLVDVYDALKSDRPYKEAFPEDKVLTILREGIGQFFCPEIHQAFERTYPEIRRLGDTLADEKRPRM